MPCAVDIEPNEVTHVEPMSFVFMCFFRVDEIRASDVCPRSQRQTKAILPMSEVGYDQTPLTLPFHCSRAGCAYRDFFRYGLAREYSPTGSDETRADDLWGGTLKEVLQNSTKWAPRTRPAKAGAYAMSTNIRDLATGRRRRL